MKKSLYNSLITHHRVIKKLLNFYAKDYEQLKQLWQIQILVNKVNSELENDLVREDRFVENPAELESGKFVVYQAYNLQNPRPAIDTAVSVLASRTYNFLPSNVTAEKINLKKVIDETFDQSKIFLMRNAIHLLKTGFKIAYDADKNMITYESVLYSITFTIDYYEAHGGAIFWALWDFSLKEVPAISDNLKNEIVILINQFILTALVKQNEELLSSLRSFLLYFVIFLIRNFIALRFSFLLKQNKESEKGYKFLEADTDKQYIQYSLKLLPHHVHNSAKFSFRVYNIAQLHLLIPDFLFDIFQSEVQFSLLEKITMQIKPSLLIFSPEFENRLAHFLFGEVFFEKDILPTSKLELEYDSENPAKFIQQLLDKFQLNIYSRIIEGLKSSERFKNFQASLFVFSAANVEGRQRVPPSDKKIHQMLLKAADNIDFGPGFTQFRLVFALEALFVVIYLDTTGYFTYKTTKYKVDFYEKTLGFRKVKSDAKQMIRKFLTGLN